MNYNLLGLLLSLILQISVDTNVESNTTKHSSDGKTKSVNMSLPLCVNDKCRYRQSNLRNSTTVTKTPQNDKKPNQRPNQSVMSSSECAWKCDSVEYVPYCGSNRVTYFNKCEADKGICYSRSLNIDNNWATPCSEFYSTLSDAAMSRYIERHDNDATWSDGDAFKQQTATEVDLQHSSKYGDQLLNNILKGNNTCTTHNIFKLVKFQFMADETVNMAVAMKNTNNSIDEELNLRLKVTSHTMLAESKFPNTYFAALSLAGKCNCIRLHGRQAISDDLRTILVEQRRLSHSVNDLDIPKSCEEAGDLRFADVFQICGGRYIRNSSGEESIVFTFPQQLTKLIKNAIDDDTLGQVTTNDQTNVSKADGLTLNICVLPNPYSPIHMAGNVSFYRAFEILRQSIRVQSFAKVKLFLNPGWDLAFAIGCSYCDYQMNRASLKIDGQCRGAFDEDTYDVASPQLQPNHTINSTIPDSVLYRMTTDFRIKPNTLQNWRLRFISKKNHNGLWPLFSYEMTTASLSTSTQQQQQTTVTNSSRNNQQQKKSTTGRSMRTAGQASEELLTFAICFYKDENDISGTFVGNAQFIPDHTDAAELVALLMFTLMGLPLLCGVTLSCYSYRQRRGRKVLRRIRLIEQFGSIEQSLLNELGIPLDGESPPSSSSSSTIDINDLVVDINDTECDNEDRNAKS